MIITSIKDVIRSGRATTAGRIKRRFLGNVALTIMRSATELNTPNGHPGRTHDWICNHRHQRSGAGCRVLRRAPWGDRRQANDGKRSVHRLVGAPRRSRIGSHEALRQKARHGRQWRDGGAGVPYRDREAGASTPATSATWTATSSIFSSWVSGRVGGYRATSKSTGMRPWASRPCNCARFCSWFRSSGDASGRSLRVPVSVPVRAAGA